MEQSGIDTGGVDESRRPIRTVAGADIEAPEVAQQIAGIQQIRFAVSVQIHRDWSTRTIELTAGAGDGSAIVIGEPSPEIQYCKLAFLLGAVIAIGYRVPQLSSANWPMVGCGMV